MRLAHVWDLTAHWALGIVFKSVSNHVGFTAWNTDFLNSKQPLPCFQDCSHSLEMRQWMQLLALQHTALVPCAASDFIAPIQEAGRTRWISSSCKNTVTHIFHLLRECSNCQPVMLAVGTSAEHSKAKLTPLFLRTYRPALTICWEHLLDTTSLGSREEITTFLDSDPTYLLGISGKAISSFHSLITMYWTAKPFKFLHL